MRLVTAWEVSFTRSVDLLGAYNRLATIPHAGTVAIRIASSDVINSAVVAHPGNCSVEEIKAMKVCLPFFYHERFCLYTSCCGLMFARCLQLGFVQKVGIKFAVQGSLFVYLFVQRISPLGPNCERRPKLFSRVVRTSLSILITSSRSTKVRRSE